MIIYYQRLTSQASKTINNDLSKGNYDRSSNNNAIQSENEYKEMQLLII